MRRRLSEDGGDVKQKRGTLLQRILVLQTLQEEEEEEERQ